MADEQKDRFLDQVPPPNHCCLRPELKGIAYRFSILLPVISQGRQVFQDCDIEGLQRLLTEDFGGCTYTPNITHPLLEGTWLNSFGEMVRDKHYQFVVYTTQDNESTKYFIELQEKLEKHGNQDKVVIEQTTVRLV